MAGDSVDREYDVPKVTVAIPCFNHGAFLAETLDSVEAQTFTDYEIIIVNDGSTDRETLEFLETLIRPKTRLISTVNLGVAAARNRAIAEALGEYVLPLDADDKIAPNYIEKAVSILEAKPEVGIVYTDQILFGAKQGLLVLPPYNRRRLLVENLIHASAVFRKSLWAEVGGYSEKMTRGWEDWDFWIAVSELGAAVVKLDEPLFYYRINHASRDSAMGLSGKLAMYGRMVRRHKTLYSRNIGYVLCRLFTHAVSGVRRV